MKKLTDSIINQLSHYRIIFFSMILIGGIVASCLIIAHVYNASENENNTDEQNYTQQGTITSAHSTESLDGSYSHTELEYTLQTIMDKMNALSESDVHRQNFVEMYLADEENVIVVVLENTDEDSIQWFTENVCNKPYVRFQQAQGKPGMDASAAFG